ncbi:MAG TPA: hypothetical protein VKR53_20260 [Puia sp.]|nr:hypothetical protein [Puia sp.]
MGKLFLAGFIFLFAESCKKGEASVQNFQQGDAIIRIDSAIAVQQAFNEINGFGLAVAEVSGYVYTTTIPADSISYIADVLNSKKYIHKGSFSANVFPYYLTKVVYSASLLRNMTIQNQQDLIATQNLLRMTDDLSSTKYMLLKVPTGQEEYWKNKFQTLSWAKWTELNYSAKINLGI